MAISSKSVIENTQRKHGTYRVRVEYVFDDGRKIIVGPLSTLLETDAAQILIDREPAALLQLQERDSEEAVKTDLAVTGFRQAGAKLVALAYLRAAYSTGNPYKAYLKFERFNTYRLDQGWTLGQVTANLSSVGLTTEEWTEMKDRYVYLSNNSRVNKMEAFQTVLAEDTWGEEFR